MTLRSPHSWGSRGGVRHGVAIAASLDKTGHGLVEKGSGPAVTKVDAEQAQDGVGDGRRIASQDQQCPAEAEHRVGSRARQLSGVTRRPGGAAGTPRGRRNA